MGVAGELKQIAADLRRVAQSVNDSIFRQWLEEDAARLDDIARAIEPNEAS